MTDLISVGDTTIDLYFKGDSLTKNGARFQLAVGGKYFVNHFHVGVGGGGANVALNVARAGYKVILISKIGHNHFEKVILDRLKRASVSVKLSQFEDDYYNLSAVLLTEKGERTIINYQNQHEHLLNDLYWQRVASVHQTKMVYFGNLPDVSLTERKVLIRKLREISQRLIINLGVNDCRRDRDQLKDFFRFADGLIINRYELADLIRKKAADLNLKNNLLYFLPEFKDKFLVVTDAEKGSYGYEKGRAYYFPPAKVKKIVDTTGAGDAYTAGFISQYLKTANLFLAMKEGTRFAGRILTQIGAN